MPMASVCARARGTLQLQASTVSATRNAVSKLCKPNSSPLLEGGPSKFVGLASSRKPKSATRFSLQGLFNSRIPVELGCAESLMPLHCATASALFTSLLSVQSRSWGSLSEGFATPL